MSIGSEALSSLPIAGIGGDAYVGDVTVRPDGWKATTFGQAGIVLAQKGWVVSSFPAPLAIHNTINTPSGWAPTVFGTPTTIASLAFQAASFGKIAVFGTPLETNAVACPANGRQHVVFGEPVGRGVFHANPPGVLIPSFGQANSIFRTRPTGWKTPFFGQAQVSRAQRAHGFLATKMGSPKMDRTTPYNPILSLPTLHVRTRNAEIFVLT